MDPKEFFQSEVVTEDGLAWVELDEEVSIRVELQVRSWANVASIHLTAEQVDDLIEQLQHVAGVMKREEVAA